MSARVTVEPQGSGVSIVRLTRPEARNAADFALVRELRAALARVAADRGCRVVVLAGAGAGFCAGLDLKTCVLGPEAAQDAAQAGALQDLFAGTIPIVRSMPQPVVAAVQGAAVGFGFGLALAADVRVVAASARFLVGAVRIGLGAGECGISYHLPRLIGAGRALEIMLTGRPVAAEEAVAIGLASRCVPDAALEDETLELARAIAANSAFSIRQTKAVAWANLDAPGLDAALALEDAVQTVGMLGTDFREGAAAFAEKRAARFHAD